MRVITCNVNGLRSALKKGFFEWLLTQEADIICLQETRMQVEQVTSSLNLPGYHAYFCHAEKKGYSGVAIYTRFQPDNVVSQLGWDIADKEGRYLQVDFGDISIASLYLPSGTSGDVRQQCKIDFMARYEMLLAQQAASGRQLILCGDWNIAHHPIDLKNWRANQKNSGFLPEERAWLDKLFNEIGYIDAFRVLESGPHHYTWWSNRGRARENNVGWRIDYQIVTANLHDKLLSTAIYTAQRFSDHAPLIVDYAVSLAQ